jgi:hypothetical protein
VHRLELVKIPYFEEKILSQFNYGISPFRCERALEHLKHIVSSLMNPACAPVYNATYNLAQHYILTILALSLLVS